MTTVAAKPRSTLRSTFGVGAGLLVLWGLSLALSYVALGTWALPVALGIAALKGALVVTFFMELFHERVSVRYAFGVGILMVTLLIAFVVADVLMRTT
jgi:caa(3)-type oxidase subunit IV